MFPRSAGCHPILEVSLHAADMNALTLRFGASPWVKCSGGSTSIQSTSSGEGSASVGLTAHSSSWSVGRQTLCGTSETALPQSSVPHSTHKETGKGDLTTTQTIKLGVRVEGTAKRSPDICVRD